MAKHVTKFGLKGFETPSPLEICFDPLIIVGVDIFWNHIVLDFLQMPKSQL